MFALASLALLLASPVWAGIYITSPIQGTPGQGGQPITIGWVDDGARPLLSEIGQCTVALYNSDNELVQTLPTTDVSTTSSLTFTVDPNAGADGQYYIVFNSNIVSGYQAYSASFPLSGMTGTSPSGGSSAPAPASTDASPSDASSNPVPSPTDTDTGADTGTDTGLAPATSTPAIDTTVPSDSTAAATTGTPVVTTTAAATTGATTTTTSKATTTTTKTSATSSATATNAAGRVGSSTSLGGIAALFALSGIIAF